jgi:phage/plasmid primase-like uncharacterized protein
MRNIANQNRDRKPRRDKGEFNEAEVLSQFGQALNDMHLRLSHGESLHGDGSLYRCDASNKEHGHGVGDGSYVLHLDGWPAGYIHNWTTGAKRKWRFKCDREPTDAERRGIEKRIEESKRQCIEARQLANDQAQTKADEWWNRAREATAADHAYLKTKDVEAYGVRHRRDGNLIIVPIRDADGVLWNVQKIWPSGKKRFLAGGKVAGCFHGIAAVKGDDGTHIDVCTGYATSATCAKATRHRTYVAFDDGNLLAVAKIEREKHPDAIITVIGDDDWKVDGNPGTTAANEAAREIDGLVAIPKFPSSMMETRADDDSDFNDLARMTDLKTVGRQIVKAVAPANDANDDDGHKSAKGDKKNKKQAEILIDIVDAEAQLFHTAEYVPYADIEVDGHLEVWAVESLGFKRWLKRRHYEETGSAPNAESLRTAIGVIEAKAIHPTESKRCKVFMRVGKMKGKLYIDLCNNKWQAVEVDAKGWRVIDEPPVRFVRRQHMRPLPTPVKGGEVETLRKYVNVKSEESFVLIVSYLLDALRHGINHVVLLLMGEQGTAKSTLILVLRGLYDPVGDEIDKKALRAPPKDNRDLFIAANNSYGVSLDNLSAIPEWLSDSLCRLSTGGAYSTRQLWTDDEEKVFGGTRAVILGSIDNVVIRGDLVDRTLSVKLDIISEEDREDEDTFWIEFKKDAPGILGALLDVMSHGLREMPKLKPTKLPRMADSAKWIMACERALWDEGTFMRAYANNRAAGSANVIESDPVALELRKWIRGHGTWKSAATPLLKALNQFVGEEVIKRKDWPKAANTLSHRLTRLAPELRRMGIDITSEPHTRTRRTIFTIDDKRDRK